MSAIGAEETIDRAGGLVGLLGLTRRCRAGAPPSRFDPKPTLSPYVTPQVH
jgi:hypothetical protein